MERAQTKIDPGSVSLRNRWLERRWSNYLGCTQELLLGDGEDWGGGDSPEFRIEIAGRAWSAKDCGAEHWTEDCDPHCASLTAEYPAGTARIVVETQLFHDAPAWRKTVRVFNPGRDALRVGRAAPEVIALRQGLGIHMGPAQPACRSWHQHSAANYVALMRGGAGLLLGLPGGGTYALFDPVPGCAALYREIASLVPPGGSLTLPETFGVFFRSGLDAVESREYADYLSALRQWRQHRACRAAMQENGANDGAGA
jgi:hypothetical protein